MSTKACHLEVVTSLHEEACLAAIALSCARPGQPTIFLTMQITFLLQEQT